MATHQFVIELIPKEWVENKNNNIEALFDDDLYDLTLAWQHYQLTVDLDSLLSQILPKGKSWNECLEVWGDTKRNDIQVRLEDNNIVSVKFRLDLSDNIENLKLKLIDFANQLNCLLFFPELRQIAPPTIYSLNKAISRSNAARFVNGPEKFLDERR